MNYMKIETSKKTWKTRHKPRTHSQNIGIEFGVEKFVILIMKREKRIKTFGEKENYKYWEILKVDIIKER